MEEIGFIVRTCVNSAIKEVYSKRSAHISEELIKYLPKEFLVHHCDNIENIYNKLPLELRQDPIYIE